MLSILNSMKKILENDQLNDETKLEYIFDLSTPLNRAINKIGDAARPVGTHLAKIIMFGFKQDWCKHIVKNLNELTIGWIIKPKNRLVNKSEYQKWLKESITTEKESKIIIKNAIDEWKEEKTKYEKKIKNLNQFEFLNIWSNFVDELTKIYIGDIKFKYKDIEKIIKSLNLNCSN